MKNIVSLIKTGCFMVILACAAGCMNIDYVGQKYKPLPPDYKVQFYEEHKDVPSGKYVVIGKAEVTAPDSYTGYEIREKLLDYARRRGAGAVEMVSFKRVDVGKQAIPESGIYDDGPTGQWGRYARRADGSPIYTDSFNSTVPLKYKTLQVYELQGKFLFLRDKSKFPVKPLNPAGEKITLERKPAKVIKEKDQSASQKEADKKTAPAKAGE